MQSIFDAMSEIMNLDRRLRSIEKLFTVKLSANRSDGRFGGLIQGLSYQLSVQDAANGALFLGWSGRRGSASPSDMRQLLGIDDLDAFQGNEVLACHYLEYVYNVAKLVKNEGKSHNVFFDAATVDAILLDVSDAAGLMGMRFEESGEGEYRLCIEKPEIMTAAALSDDVEKVALIEYLHFSNEGDLERKRAILARLYAGFEVRRPILKESGSRALESTIGNLVNNLGIRHNNRTGNHESPILNQMSEEELEGWYDYIAGLYAEAILAEQRISRAQEAKVLSEGFQSR